MRFKQALNKIIEYSLTLDGEKKDLDELRGRVLFEDICTPMDFPSTPRSAMDGYAVCVDDIDKLPKKLSIQGSIGVDEVGFKLKRDCAFWVNTGSPLPEGANCVIMVEKVDVEENMVIIKEKPAIYHNVTKKGAEIKKGMKILNRGDLINVRKWALLAHCGITNALVFKRPKVAVFTTGNEVITPYDTYKEGKVYNTNFYILKGLVEKWGGEFHYVSHLRDDMENIKEALDKAFLSFDVIVTTGGVSRGKTDFTKKAIEECGVNIVFSKPNLKPGRPFTFGIKNKTLLFAFSGPPAAMFMTAYAFLKPALFYMNGRNHREELFDCKLLEDMHSKKGKLYLNRVRFADEEMKASAGSSGSQKSDNFLSVVNADGFIMIDEDKGDVGKFSVFKGGRFDD